MKKIILKINETKITAALNKTIAALDFYSRLPLALKFIDSGVDYCCNYSQGTYSIESFYLESLND